MIVQKSYGGLNTDLRGARLDVYVESDDSAEIDASEDASIYDLEPDKNDKAKYIAAFPQRIRFYHAIIDSRSLKSGVSAWRGRTLCRELSGREQRNQQSD